MGNMPAVFKQNVRRDPTLPVTLQIPHHYVTVGDIDGRRVFGLLSIRLFHLRTINISKVDHFLPTLMMDRETISLVDDEDSCNKISLGKRRVGYAQGKHQACRKAMLHHDFVCYRQQHIEPIISQLLDMTPFTENR